MDANEARRFLSALKGMGIESYFVVKKDEITLPMLQKQVKACTRCPLARTRRTVVFGEGNEKAELVFVGEAPGEEEDLQGRPFVGRAGKLLDQMIQRMRLSRKDVFICNVLKCRPPQNRDPDASEIDMCKNYLFAQLEIIEPKVICALGRHAYNTLMGVDARITKIRGQITAYNGIALLPTYHPSFLLRNQDRMKEALEDMEKLREILKGR
ncbi:MAG: uracil glycosylase superfamily protein [Deltaproteobacteria bacterium]|jgi:DNA polymerase|nr:uracil glycosylase superfamily protein [Deltaproteobacteria bacterium]